MNRPAHELERFGAGRIVGYVTDDGSDLFVGSQVAYLGFTYRGCVWGSRADAATGDDPVSICQHHHRKPLRAIECAEKALEEGLA